MSTSFYDGESCLLCGRPVHVGEQTPSPIYDGQTGAARFPHRACMLREVVGGIGHLIAHEYWCTGEISDPDAGLERWQSARLVELYVELVGVDAAVRTGH